MNINSIKHFYEKMPKTCKRALAPIFIYSILSNSIYKKTIQKLNMYDQMSEIEREREQFVLLKETLQYAYDYVPYYKEVFNKNGFIPSDMKSVSEMNKIPLLTKDLAIEAGNSIYSTDKQYFFESFTGGSSGRALKVLLDKNSIYTERAFVCHYLSKYGYDVRKNRTLAFWGHNKDKDYYYSPLKNEIVVSPFKLFDENAFELVWKLVEEFKPSCISGYPSAIYLFAQLMERHEKRKVFQLVDFYAENYTNEMKSYIEKTLHCQVVSNYGHTERAVWAEEYGGGYLFNKLYGYTEFLPTENENEFQIVATGFTSRKMPLIRYVTDDVVRFNENEYAEILGHKSSEVCLVSKSGSKIFKGALTMHLNAFHKVKQYQYVQYEKGKVYLDLVLLEPLTEDEKQDIKQYLIRRCEGQLDIEIRIVDSVILTHRGKYNWAINRIRM